MAPQDWHVLKKLGMHTLNNGAAIISFEALTYLIKQGMEDGFLRTILDGTESGVLIVLVLVFACQVIYDVLPEKIHEVLEKIRESMVSKFVFA